MRGPNQTLDIIFYQELHAYGNTIKETLCMLLWHTAFIFTFMVLVLQYLLSAAWGGHDHFENPEGNCRRHYWMTPPHPPRAAAAAAMSWMCLNGRTKTVASACELAGDILLLTFYLATRVCACVIRGVSESKGRCCKEELTSSLIFCPQQHHRVTLSKLSRLILPDSTLASLLKPAHYWP